MSFLDKYSSAGATRGKTLSTDEGYKKWKSDNARILIEGVYISPSDIGANTMRVLNTLEASEITPKKGQMLRIRTQAELNMVVVVIALAQSGKCEELVIATYSLNKEALDTLCAMVEKGSISKLRIIMASSISYRDPEHKITMISKSKTFGFDLAFVYSHLKIMLMKCGDQYFHAEGSMNFSRNNSAENLVISNSKEAFKIDYEFLSKTMLSPGHKAIEVINWS